MKKIVFTVLLSCFIVIFLKAQSNTNSFYAGFSIKSIGLHNSSSSSIMAGLNAVKGFSGDDFALGFHFLKDLNSPVFTIIGSSYAMDPFYYGSISGSGKLINMTPDFGIVIGTAIGLGFVKEEIQDIDQFSEGWNGFWSFEPRLGVDLTVNAKWNVAFGATWFLYNNSSETLKFASPAIDLSFLYRIN